MKALVYTAPGQLAYKEVDNPSPGPDEVVVKVKAVGICGSDMHAYNGHDERRPAPLILGHEVSGVIVDTDKPDQRVTINPLVNCMSCEYCLANRTNLCPHRQIISMPPRAGGFAEFISIPKRNLIPVEDHISHEQAALAEPISVAWHAVRLATEKSDRDIADSKILVMGGGAIGLACALVCRHFKCESILITETNQLRHDILSQAGPFQVCTPDELDNSTLFDCVFDAYGGTATQRLASKIIRPGGLIVNLGLAGGDVGLDIRKMTLQDIGFFGSYTYTQSDFEHTVRAINQSQLGSLDWFKAYSLNKGPELFEQINTGRMPYPKVILNPNG